MPGLPYSNPEKDLRLFKMLFDDERFRPDQLKIYPCQIVKDSPLAKAYKVMKYKSYTTEQTKELLQKMFPLIPNYCRIMRVMREIPKEKMITEPIKLDLRRDIEENFRKQGIKMKEIRMREIGFNESNSDELKLKITSYSASNGQEHFLEIINDEDILFGLLRLRIFNGKAIIRELHVYGKTLNLGDKGNISQHKGIGKWLMGEAEDIVKKQGIKELVVISGVGVREYYRKLGYKLEGFYMVKEI